MLNQQTMDKMAWMHLPTMTAEYRRQLEDTQISQLSFDERFGLLVDSEWTARQNKYLGHLIVKSGMRQSACLEDLDYSVSRGLERDLVIPAYSRQVRFIRTRSSQPTRQRARCWGMCWLRGVSDMRLSLWLNHSIPFLDFFYISR
jgi:hypothetical protein